MWAVVTDSGELITEQECLWTDLPPDIRISELRYRDRRGIVGAVKDYDSYGFQRYAITRSDGTGEQHAGTQLICIFGDQVTILDINELTGERSQRDLPRRELTYSQGLLRDGVRG